MNKKVKLVMASCTVIGAMSVAQGEETGFLEDIPLYTHHSDAFKSGWAWGSFSDPKSNTDACTGDYDCDDGDDGDDETNF